jgi:hypothetical protein
MARTSKSKPKTPTSTPVATVKHRDKRANIPTEELRDFVADEEKNPKTVLYPRDPSLDPQLVWKGKDEQDSRDLAVPAVPIYIQEKIHPQAIIENVRRNRNDDLILQRRFALLRRFEITTTFCAVAPSPADAIASASACDGSDKRHGYELVDSG